MSQVWSLWHRLVIDWRTAGGCCLKHFYFYNFTRIREYFVKTSEVTSHHASCSNTIVSLAVVCWTHRSSSSMFWRQGSRFLWCTREDFTCRTVFQCLHLRMLVEMYWRRSSFLVCHLAVAAIYCYGVCSIRWSGGFIFQWERYDISSNHTRIGPTITDNYFDGI